MGYTTDFHGNFRIEPTLSPEHREYLKAFSETRRMKRDPRKAAELDDPKRVAAGLPIGPEAAYFVGGTGLCGQDSDESIVDYNREPSGQPGLWCQWIPDEEGELLMWDGGEKFYDYVEWLNYLIDHFLKPWGYKLNGRVEWDGESQGDTGTIVVKDNAVTLE